MSWCVEATYDMLAGQAGHMQVEEVSAVTISPRQQVPQAPMALAEPEVLLFGACVASCTVSLHPSNLRDLGGGGAMVVKLRTCYKPQKPPKIKVGEK